MNGSVRRNSANGHLLSAISSLYSNCLSVEIHPGLDGLPHFNPDLELPEEVLELRQKILESDYLLISTPEYAHGLPGVLKNMLDWLVSDENLVGHKVILIVAGAGDGMEAMRSLKEISKTMSLQVRDEFCLSVSAIRSKVSEEGILNPILEAEIMRIKDLICTRN